jgi:hypothetical protein
MTRSMMLRAVALVAGLGASALVGAATTGCGVEVGADYPANDDGDYPSDGYVATTDPVYYGGRANYLYNNRWYYRDGARWGRYNREPAGLAQRRTQGAPGRRNYEPSGRGRPAGGGARGRR